MSPVDFLKEWQNDAPMVRVKTSGSTGMPKEMMVEKSRMTASARMTCDFLNLRQGETALLCMSPDYIAGKMMIVRAAERNLNLFSVTPSSHPLSDESLNQGHWLTGNTTDTPNSFDFLAMVPMQVYNTLKVPEERERLLRVRHLIIGGGAIDERMEEELRDFPNAIWSSYGMTETLSHIAMRKINGEDASQWYEPLPGITVGMSAEGCLEIEAPTVCGEKLTTNDIIEIKKGEKGREKTAFRVVGRRDNVICSGGIKIQAEEVEAKLRGVFDVNFAICKRKNELYGECVVLVSEGGDVQEIRKRCEETLPRYWQPKEYIIVDKIPKTETDKIARKRLEEMIR